MGKTVQTRETGHPWDILDIWRESLTLSQQLTKTFLVRQLGSHTPGATESAAETRICVLQGELPPRPRKGLTRPEKKIRLF